MALELNGTTGVSLVQDGVVTAADLSSTLDLTGKTVTLPASQETAVVLLGEYAGSASEVSSVDISLDTSGDYWMYKIVIPMMKVGNNGEDLWWFVSKNGTYQTASNYTWSMQERNGTAQAGTQSSGATYGRLCWYPWPNNDGEAGGLEVNIRGSADANIKTTIHGAYAGQDNVGGAKSLFFTGMYNVAATHDGFRFSASAGNVVMQYGYKLYGYKS